MVNPSSVLSFFVPKIALYMYTYKAKNFFYKKCQKLSKILDKLDGGGYNNIENLQLIGKWTKIFSIMEDIYYER